MPDYHRILSSPLNDAYRGSRYSVAVLFLFALSSVVTGGIHAFLPDGGAGVIAGLDLSHSGPTIIGVFAWAGATQLVWGMMLLAIALRARVLVPMALLLLLLEQIVIGFNIWVFKFVGGDHRPPQAYATLFVIPLLILALHGALRMHARRK